MSIWDSLSLDVEQEECIRAIKAMTRVPVQEGVAGGTIGNVENPVEPTVDEDQIYNIQENLAVLERSCSAFVRELDDMVTALDEINASHSSVTGRTNSLMRNCEDLLERQVPY